MAPCPPRTAAPPLPRKTARPETAAPSSSPPRERETAHPHDHPRAKTCTVYRALRPSENLSQRAPQWEKEGIKFSSASSPEMALKKIQTDEHTNPRPCPCATLSLSRGMSNHRAFRMRPIQDHMMNQFPVLIQSSRLLKVRVYT